LLEHRICDMKRWLVLFVVFLHDCSAADVSAAEKLSSISECIAAIREYIAAAATSAAAVMEQVSYTWIIIQWYSERWRLFISICKFDTKIFVFISYASFVLLRAGQFDNIEAHTKCSR
jgi:hypothetical protein